MLEIKVKTLADLKRDLKIGNELICHYHYRAENKDMKRVISKVNTAGVKFERKFLDFPKSASLLDYKGNIFTIYDIGKRKPTEKEWEERYNFGYNKHQTVYGSLSTCVDDCWVLDKNIRGQKLYTFEIK